MANDDRNLPSRLAPVITVVLLLLVGSLVPKGTVAPRDSLRLAGTKARAERQSRGPEKSPKAGIRVALGAPAAAPGPQPKLDVQLAGGGPDLSPYEDLGSWIDIYDEWPWAHPGRAVHELDHRGVGTIFLQTSNWGSNQDVFKRAQTAKFLKEAHRRGMKVVSWYVPSFAQAKEDYERSRAAILFEKDGHRFDSFGLDIESTVVDDIARRNKRLLKLSKRLRRLVGPDYTLGAITPDAVKALYWPNFPYKRVDKLYDVFVPMGYFSFRTSGYRGVKNYTLASIRNIRRATGNPDVRIHLIGGIGGETNVPEVKGFVRVVRAKGILGASYYDMTVTTEEEWDELETIAEDPDPPPAPQETAIAIPEVRPTPLAPEIEAAGRASAKTDKKNSKGKDDKKSKGRKDDKKRSKGKDLRKSDRKRRDRKG